ncbi:MAG: tRNA (adenosine(37)-N6)-threonylcarbamoyltransferase complex ATPase subunit type 1 TsaE [Chitinophagales bacterium]
MQIQINHIDEISKVVASIIEKTKEQRIFLFKGDLGAGKTTIIQEICRQLGVQESMSSPTYGFVNEYNANTLTIYHMDLSRLNSMEEAFDIGIEEYLDSGNYCFIEWFEVIEDLLPNQFVKIEIEKISDEARKMSIFIAE